MPVSMLDWPGKVCSVIFLAGCNFRCPYCHNPELIYDDKNAEGISWDDLEPFLSERNNWIDGVSITGGEPTINPALPLLVRKIKESGLQVKLDTNGSRPRVLERLIADGLLDFVAMDIKTSLKKYPLAAGRLVDTDALRESLGIILSSGVACEFRCTVVPGLVDVDDLKSIAAGLSGGGRFVLQQFRSEITLDPAYTNLESYPETVLFEWAEELSEMVPTKVRGTLGVVSRV